MSYEVLARRFRPQTFDEVEGQRHVVTALRNAIELGRVPHAILLAGPRGVAKTTLARILARALNCDEGPTEKPCGRCSPCLEIAAGTSLDVQEIDAASATPASTTCARSARACATPPRPGSTASSSSTKCTCSRPRRSTRCLKTLEEPPPRSLFIFATTDPQKIPHHGALARAALRPAPARRTRSSWRCCGRSAPPTAIEAPEPVLRAIAREADGSGRDALTLLDRLTSALGTKIGRRGRDRDPRPDRPQAARRRARAGARARSGAGAASRCAACSSRASIPTRLAGDLLAELRDLVVARLVDDPTGLIDAAPDALEELRARAQAARRRDAAAAVPRAARRACRSCRSPPARSTRSRWRWCGSRRCPRRRRWRRWCQKLDALESGGSGPAPVGPGRTVGRRGADAAAARLRGPARARRRRAAPRAEAARPLRRLHRRPSPRPRPPRAAIRSRRYHVPAQARRDEPPLPDDAEHRSSRRRRGRPRRAPRRRRALGAEPRAAHRARGARARRGQGAPARARGDRGARRRAARDPRRRARGVR